MQKSELLFQISNTSYSAFPCIDRLLSCPHIDKNQEYVQSVRCVNMIITVVLD